MGKGSARVRTARQSAAVPVPSTGATKQQAPAASCSLDIEELFRKGNCTLLKKALKSGQLSVAEVRGNDAEAPCGTQGAGGCSRWAS